MKSSFKLLLLTIISASLNTSTLFSATAGAGMRAIADESHSPHHSNPGTDHNHQPLEIPQGQAVPKVDLIVHSDAMQGWNLEIKVSNFQFAPSQANQAGKVGEGHAHLYINGEKVTRIYGNWFYLKSLEPGKNQLRVTLNTNDHKGLYYQGQPIEDTEIIQVP